MTKEEKAKKLGVLNARQYRHNYGGDEFVFSNEECETSALEMAEWKDQQFKRALIRKIVEYEKKVHDVVESGEGDVKVYIEPQKAIKQIINELFPEQEQDNSDNDE